MDLDARDSLPRVTLTLNSPRVALTLALTPTPTLTSHPHPNYTLTFTPFTLTDHRSPITLPFNLTLTRVFLATHWRSLAASCASASSSERRC